MWKIIMKYKNPACDTKQFRAGFNIHKKFWGESHFSITIDRFLEEAAELAKELLKWKRGKLERNGKPIDEAIKDEFGDCLLTLEYLARAKGFTLEEIQSRITAKSIRIVENLKKEMEQRE
jgi:NTP pyrophosphatase (non-canonical NTP hydrolase)